MNACSTGNTNVPNTQWGYQTARTGVAFVGMFYDNGNGNNYFQVKLTDSLITDKRYYIEYYVVNPKKYYRLACNNVSLFLSNKAVYTDTTFYTSLLLANAQVYNYGNPIIYDTVNWVKVSSIYRAIGGEQYITLGNFKNSNQTNYSIKLPAIGSYYNGASYSVDDVSVILLDSMPLKADAGRDTTIHIGDSAFIGSLTNGIDSLKWQILNSNNTIDSIRPGFWVHPLVNTCYVLTQTVNGYTSSDTVCVNVLPLPLKFLKYELSLRGTKQSVENIWQTANEINVSHFYVQRSTNGRDFSIIGKVKANGASYNEYSYEDNSLPFMVYGSLVYYKIIAVDIDGKLSYSEVRQLIINHSSLTTIGVYPNPANKTVKVNCSNAKTITIVDILGNIVLSKEISNSNEMELNISTFTTGLYLVKLQNSNGSSKFSKLIVQH